MNADIVTITLNPAIDHTVFLDRLSVGKVNRTTRHCRQAGGKGINVSSMLGDFGLPGIATGFLGKDNQRVFTNLFKSKNICDEFIRIPGETRTGVKIVDEATRETTDINFPGLEPTFAELQAFEKKLRKLVKPDRWFVLAGSLPVGISPDFFEEILALLKRGGAKVAADTSGDALDNRHRRRCRPGEAERARARRIPRPRSAGFRFAPRCRPTAPEGKSPACHPFVRQRRRALHQPGKSPDGRRAAGQGRQHRGGRGRRARRISRRANDRPLAIYRAKLATVFAWCALEDVRRQLPSAAEIQKRLPRIKVQPLPG